MRQWYAETGCLVVLNTSLNIKGQPTVNTEAEAEEFAKHYKVKVHVRLKLIVTQVKQPYVMLLVDLIVMRCLKR